MKIVHINVLAKSLMAMKKFKNLLGNFIPQEEEITITPKSQRKNVLILGADTAVGRELALILAKEHHRLLLVSNTNDGIQDLVSEVAQSSSPDDVKSYHFDPTEDSIKTVVEKGIEDFSAVDVLVICTEEDMNCKFSDIDNLTSALKNIMDINYYAPIFFSHFLFPHLRKTRGKIVLLSSYIEEECEANHSLFNASRSATLGFFGTLHSEDTNGVITVVIPGYNQYPQKISASGQHVGQSVDNADQYKETALLLYRAVR